MQIGCIFDRAMLDSKLSAEELRLLLAVLVHTKSGGWCTATPETLSAATGIEEVAVSRCLIRLVSTRYLETRRMARERWYRLAAGRESERIAIPPAGQSQGMGGDVAPARRQAALSGDLVQRPTVLATLLSDQDDHLTTAATIDGQPAPEDGGAAPFGAGFALWLRTVLSPEDGRLFQTWARAHARDHRDLRQRFAKATDDGDLEALLHDTLAVVAGAAPSRPQRTVPHRRE